MHHAACIILSLVLVALLGLDQGAAQIPPASSRPYGWVAGTLKWDAEVTEFNTLIRRTGGCEFRLDFGANGTNFVTFAYKLQDTTFPFAGQKQVETIEGKVTKRQFTGSLSITSTPGGGFDITYRNPSYDISSKIQRYTFWNGQWVTNSTMLGPITRRPPWREAMLGCHYPL